MYIVDRRREAEGLGESMGSGCRYKGRGSESVLATPGQFASFDFTGIKGKDGETLNRTWTISSPAQEMKAKEQFSVTIKKVGTHGLPASASVSSTLS
jgi:ferredoxin-NADP reductase